MEKIEEMKERDGVRFWPILFEISIRNPMDILGKVPDIHFELSRKHIAENKN